jgi:hypothetical protein
MDLNVFDQDWNLLFIHLEIDDPGFFGDFIDFIEIFSLKSDRNGFKRRTVDVAGILPP